MTPKAFPFVLTSRQTVAFLLVTLGVVFLYQTLFLSYPFDVDEAFNWWVSKDGFAVAYDRIRDDFFPPLYNSILAGVLKILPHTEFSIRLPSLLFGLTSLWLLYRFFKRAEGLPFALMVILMVVSQISFTYWGQIARSFSLEIMGLMGYFTCLFSLLDAADKKQPMHTAQLLWAGVFALIAVYSNHGAVYFIFFAYGAAVLARISGGEKILSPFLLRLTGLHAVVFLCWLPLVPYILHQASASSDVYFPQHYPDISKLLPIVGNYVTFGDFYNPIIRYGALVLSGLLYACGSWYLWRRQRSFGRALVLFTSLYLVITVGSVALHPTLLGRIFQRGASFVALYVIVLTYGIGYAYSLIGRVINALVSRPNIPLQKLAWAGLVSGVIGLKVIAFGNIHDMYHYKFGHYARFAATFDGVVGDGAAIHNFRNFSKYLHHFYLRDRWPHLTIAYSRRHKSLDKDWRKEFCAGLSASKYQEIWLKSWLPKNFDLQEFHCPGFKTGRLLQSIDQEIMLLEFQRLPNH